MASRCHSARERSPALHPSCTCSTEEGEKMKCSVPALLGGTTRRSYGLQKKRKHIQWTNCICKIVWMLQKTGKATVITLWPWLWCSLPEWAIVHSLQVEKLKLSQMSFLCKDFHHLCASQRLSVLGIFSVFCLLVLISHLYLGHVSMICKAESTMDTLLNVLSECAFYFF